MLIISIGFVKPAFEMEGRNCFTGIETMTKLLAR
jgi:hypothetical protein